MSYHNFKDYVCPVCSKDFSKPSQLKKHLKDAHEIIKTNKEVKELKKKNESK